METTKRIILTIAAFGVFTFSGFASADPIPVTYEIGPYAASGYSASWLHAADGCGGTPTGGSGSTLYMCGSADAATGLLSGSFDAGILTITGGSLWVNGSEHLILSGSLGGAFTYGTGANTSSWFIELAGLGTFFFEGFDMGDGRPNEMSLDEFILWGQNLDAYQCAPGNTECDRWGIDLYGHRVDVPEPGTLVLLSAGLFGMALMQRRRKVAYARKS